MRISLFQKKITIFLLLGFLILPAKVKPNTENKSGKYINSIGMQFKTIPTGDFYMGSCQLKKVDNIRNAQRIYLGLKSKPTLCPFDGHQDLYADEDEIPQHRVSITRSFQMGIYEVTLGQFKQFLTSARRLDLVTDDFMKHNRYGDTAPVTYVSWNDAYDFIEWLNEKEQTKRYRLPTEAEWEYATRAGTTTIYSWGNDSRSAGDYAWYKKNTWDAGKKHPHQVGTKKPNRWGIYDLHGNVMEWVQDWYHEFYYQNKAKKMNPRNSKGPEVGFVRILRGGSWLDDSDRLRTADRYYRDPAERYFNLGFRLVRDL